MKSIQKMCLNYIHFPSKGGSERDQEQKRKKGKGEQKLGSFPCHISKTKKCKLAQRPGVCGMPQSEAQMLKSVRFEESWKWRR